MAGAIKSFFFRRFSILDKYLLNQFLGPFILAVGGFALIAMIDILFYLVELTIISGVPFTTVIRLLLYKLPAIMVLFFPMAVLFAVMLLLVRMAKDNELTVLRVSGVSTFRILFPIILLALLTSFISYYFNEIVVPWTNRSSDILIKKEVKKTPPPNIVENIVFKDSGGRFFYIKKIEKNAQIMHNVLVFNSTARYPRIITAKTASWHRTSWTLQNGQIQEISKEGMVDFVDNFTELVINVDQNINAYFSQQKTAKQMDSRELSKKINILQKGGISTRSYRVEYHMKKSVPAACFIFGIIGIALCLSFVRSGKDWWGVILSICISVLLVGFYFFILAVSRAMAKEGDLIPFLGAWIPNMVYGFIAILIITYQSLSK
jgi:lipopolysaccharide export system permease protein